MSEWNELKVEEGGGARLDKQTKNKSPPPPVPTTMMTIFGGELNLSIIKSNFLQKSIMSEMQRWTLQKQYR